MHKLPLIKNIIIFTLLILTIIGSNIVMAKTSAIIFDCDGVLVDTEHLKYQAWQQALAQHGVDFTINEYKPLIGLSSKKIMAQITKQKALTINETNLINEKNIIYDKLQLSGVTPIPDAIIFFKELIANKNKYNIKIGLASSAPRSTLLHEHCSCTD